MSFGFYYFPLNSKSNVIWVKQYRKLVFDRIGLETWHLYIDRVCITQTLQNVLNQLHETISDLLGSYGTRRMSSWKKTSDATQGRCKIGNGFLLGICCNFNLCKVFQIFSLFNVVNFFFFFLSSLCLHLAAFRVCLWCDLKTNFNI